MTAASPPATRPHALQVLGLRLPIVRLSGLIIGIIVVIGLQLFCAVPIGAKPSAPPLKTGRLPAWPASISSAFTWLPLRWAPPLAGLAGMLVAIGFSVSPSIGLNWTLKALIVVVLAGLGSMPGTFVAGILLGLAEAVSALIFGGQYRELVGLILFFIILSLRPQGLFGESYG